MRANRTYSIGVALAAALCVASLATPAQAAFPGQNGKIAFASSEADSNLEIYTINPDGSGRTRLTNAPGFDFDPAWSADGNRIAFSSTRDGNPEIYSMNADGSSVTRLTDNPGGDYDPAWSPDGAKIVFTSSRAGTSGLYTMNADGTDVIQLTSRDSVTVDGAAEWSPDGTRIAARVAIILRFGPSTLYTIRPDGTDERFLAAGGVGSGGGPSWSPDGLKLTFGRQIFFGPVNSQGELFSIGADGQGEAQLTNSETVDEQDPAWSPDGSKIAFRSNLGNDIWIMNTDGTGQQNVTNSETASEFSPAWQPSLGPQRGDYKNAAQFCKAERNFFGDAVFRNRYGGGANAHAKCVSANR